ncbi:MAG TPA: hypothetical protein ENI55_03380 [Alphaproteobacteria bacterium]|nr:hypothetical protein [Alphaproteobacteria bacterium]
MSPTLSLRLAVLAAFGAAAAIISFGAGYLIYDEVPYMKTAFMLRDLGFSAEYFARYPVAAGPLYAVLHLLVSPFTDFAPPYVRYLNLGLFALIMAQMAWLLKRRGYDNTLNMALMAAAIPSVCPISGMALTEIPAMAMLGFGLIALILSDRAGSGGGAKYSLILLTGILFGITSIGRQPYLGAAVIIAFSYLVAGNWGWKEAAIFAAGLIPLPAFLFYTWQGIVPPSVAGSFSEFIVDTSRTAAGGKPAFDHLIISSGYAGLFMFLMTPGWFRINRVLIIAALAPVVLNAATGYVEITPMQSLARSYLGGDFLRVYTFTASNGIVAVAGLFIAAAIERGWKARKDGFVLSAYLSGVALTMHQVGIIVGFSSRYTAMSLPFMIIMAADHHRSSHWRAVRVGIGATAGLASLARYLQLI